MAVLNRCLTVVAVVTVSVFYVTMWTVLWVTGVLLSVSVAVLSMLSSSSVSSATDYVSFGFGSN